MKVLKLMLLFVTFLFSTFMLAQEESTKVKVIKNDFVTFLMEEGFKPTLDAELGTIDFKREGQDYWIGVVDRSGDIFQITVHLAGVNTKGYSQAAVLLACNDVNNNRYNAKAMAESSDGKEYAAFAVEMPCYSAIGFKKTFYTIVMCLSSAKTLFKEKLAEYQARIDKD
ncbi:MAG: hypothetical protein PUD36_09835 [Bacteroidales bacterium]|nr:hypothetical protein [Bacteroidales bacterium]